MGPRVPEQKTRSLLKNCYLNMENDMLDSSILLVSVCYCIQGNNVAGVKLLKLATLMFSKGPPSITMLSFCFAVYLSTTRL